ncbi:MAG: MBL fold metallo-hydrolase [Acidobacteria bacterium]|nr:MBL fold metallo-hydrolase [Acidobacteriota bacterium]
MPTAPNIHITVLGSGTSVGVPTIGCGCEVCHSDDPHDKRLRPSILVTYSDRESTRNVLIDTTPDLRQQALAAGLKRVDAVLFTHDHADHVMGMDDLRPFNYGRRERIPVYGMAETLRSLRRVFPYAFEGEARHPGGVPRVEGHELNGRAIDLFGMSFEPIPVSHGPLTVLGFRFGNAAYLTDHSDIPEESAAKLKGLDVLFLDGLRREPHPMHTSVEQALGWVERLQPKRAFFTHICHDLPHQATNESLPPHVRLAHDGLRIEVSQN